MAAEMEKVSQYWDTILSRFNTIPAEIGANSSVGSISTEGEGQDRRREANLDNNDRRLTLKEDNIKRRERSLKTSVLTFKDQLEESCKTTMFTEQMKLNLKRLTMLMERHDKLVIDGSEVNKLTDPDLVLPDSLLKLG